MQNYHPQSLVTGNELIESLLNQFNNNNNSSNNDHLLLLSPSSTNSISTASLSPSNPTPIPSDNRSNFLSSSQPQPQPIYEHFHYNHSHNHPDISIGFKPHIDRFSDHPISASLPARNPPYSAIDHQNLVLTEKRRKRRESHNAVERRRRDNINDRISELASLLPNCVLDTVVTPTESGMLIVNDPLDSPSALNSKPNKGIILAKSVDYIKQLKDLLELQVQRNGELEAELNTLRSQLTGASQQEGGVNPTKGGAGDENSIQNHNSNIIKAEEPTNQEDEIMNKMTNFCLPPHYDPSASSEHPPPHHHPAPAPNDVNLHLAFHPTSFDPQNLHLDRHDNLYHYLQ